MTTCPTPKLKAVLIGLVTVAVWFIACEPPEHPDSLFDPNAEFCPDPVITHVDPEGSARMGKDTLRISGMNFSPILEENIFYFGGVQYPISFAWDTLLKVKAPNLMADSLDMHVAVKGALRLAVWEDYSLTRR
jgi:hypothetical protein